MTVRQLLASVSSRELTEWQAFYGLEPFGDERADLRSGIVAATVANVHRDPQQEPFDVTDFMPRFEAAANEETDEERAERVWAQVNQAMLLLGGVVGDHS